MNYFFRETQDYQWATAPLQCSPGACSGASALLTTGEIICDFMMWQLHGKKWLDKDKYVCSIWNIPSMPSSAVWFLVFYRYFLHMHACKHTLIYVWVCVHLEVRHLVNSPHFAIRLTWENECCTIFRLQSIINIYIDIYHQCKLSRRKTLWTPTCHSMGNHWETSCRALRSWSGCTCLMKQ